MSEQNEIKHSGLVGWCRFTKMSLKDLFRPCLLFTELFELEETVGVSAVDSVTFKTHTAVFSFEESLSVAVLSVSGMEEAHCDRTEFLSSYPLNIDEIMLIPGSLGRIRPRDPKSTTCKIRVTQECDFSFFLNK